MTNGVSERVFDIIAITSQPIDEIEMWTFPLSFGSEAKTTV